MCHDEGMGLIPYGTLGQGRFRSRASFTEREKANPGRKIGTYSQHDKNVSAVLERVAASKSVEITSVAMAYCMAKTPHVFPLVGCRTLEHLKGNIAALQVSLSKDEIKELDAAYLFDPGFPHTFLSGTAFNPAAAPASVSGPADVWLTKMMGNFDFVEAEKPIKPAQV
jgi:aryl-alcohol dehydrogenase-like predicted oxidoreductase